MREHKSMEFLLDRKQLLTEASWQALYQQNPIIIGGSSMKMLAPVAQEDFAANTANAEERRGDPRCSKSLSKAA